MAVKGTSSKLWVNGQLVGNVMSVQVAKGIPANIRVLGSPVSVNVESDVWRGGGEMATLRENHGFRYNINNGALVHALEPFHAPAWMDGSWFNSRVTWWGHFECGESITAFRRPRIVLDEDTVILSYDNRNDECHSFGFKKSVTIFDAMCTAFDKVASQAGYTPLGALFVPAYDNGECVGVLFTSFVSAEVYEVTLQLRDKHIFDKSYPKAPETIAFMRDEALSKVRNKYVADLGMKAISAEPCKVDLDVLAGKYLDGAASILGFSRFGNETDEQFRASILDNIKRGVTKATAAFDKTITTKPKESEGARLARFFSRSEHDGHKVVRYQRPKGPGLPNVNCVNVKRDNGYDHAVTTEYYECGDDTGLDRFRGLAFPVATILITNTFTSKYGGDPHQEATTRIAVTSDSVFGLANKAYLPISTKALDRHVKHFIDEAQGALRHIASVEAK